LREARRLSHITKAICSLVVLRDAMMHGDRPPKSAPWLRGLNEKSKALFHKYPDPVPPYTEADKSWSDTE
jgi:hypothetical protein